MKRSDSKPAGKSQRGAEEFADKGPTSFRRSDERIHEDVQDALTQDGALDARNIVISVAEGRVTLTGAVRDESPKERAGALCADCAGVTEVRNRLTVPA